jgi:nucleotide-binding universal stress UspA family protein
MRVLLGIGGTEDSFRALDRTIERSVAAGDDLTVAVLDVPRSDEDPDAVLERVRDRVAAAGIDAEVRHVDGDPGSRLVATAEEEGFDRIVIGGGETSPMGKINIGGFAEFVLLNSHVSVTLIR